MSTSSKGAAFEQRVFNALSDELKKGNLGLNPSSEKIFAGENYYSKERRSNIRLDVSIEAWLPNATDWSFLWAVECKDFSKNIPVDDLEEFKAKLNQITGSNRKGTFVTSSVLQSGATNYIKSDEIGVVRLLPDNQIIHLLYQLTLEILNESEKLNPSEFYRALLEQNYQGFNRSFFSLFDDYIFDGWGSLARRVFNYTSH